MPELTIEVKEKVLSKLGLRVDDVISEEHFKQFFYDVSSVVENDKDFTQILKALGYK